MKEEKRKTMALVNGNSILEQIPGVSKRASKADTVEEGCGQGQGE